jgi:hypothetical protein
VEERRRGQLKKWRPLLSEVDSSLKFSFEQMERAARWRRGAKVALLFVWKRTLANNRAAVIIIFFPSSLLTFSVGGCAAAAAAAAAAVFLHCQPFEKALPP